MYEFHRNRGAGPKRTMNTIDENKRTKMTAYVRREAIVVSLQQRKGRKKCCPWRKGFGAHCCIWRGVRIRGTAGIGSGGLDV